MSASGSADDARFFFFFFFFFSEPSSDLARLRGPHAVCVSMCRLFPSDGAAPASDEENADAAAPPRLDQDVFKKIFSFWEPLGHEMWLDLMRDSEHLDRFCRASNICKRMLIPHVEYE